MEVYKFQIIETLVVCVAYLVIRFVSKKAIDRMVLKFTHRASRAKMIKKIINTTAFMLSCGFILTIWGVNRSELFLFLSSLITVLGIAFFAQWSIISNITATVIIFFNHPAKIGDRITVLDKDYHIDGRISDIGIFFIIIKTMEGERLTIPSNVFIQKMIKWKAQR